MKKIMIVIVLLVITNAMQAQNAQSPKSYDMTIEFSRATKSYEVVLSGSETNVSYQLFYEDEQRNQVPVGDLQEGTGNALTFTTTRIDELYIIATSKNGLYTAITPKKVEKKRIKNPPNYYKEG